MKQRVAVTMMAVVVMATMTAAAQPRYFSSLETHRSADLGKIACKYAMCLKTENAGAIESVLAHVVRMKMYAPELECPGLRKEISSLAVAGPNASVRYKAFLASLVFDTPTMFKDEAVREFNSSDELFNSIAVRLQIALLERPNTKYVRPE